MNESYQPDPNHPSFCQICGRAVASEADRLAGNAFHCGLCNEVRLASPASTGYAAPGVDPAAAGVPGPGAGPIPGGVPTGTGPFAGAGMPMGSTPGAGPGTANPGLAFLLGLIPGVGAMYNGQYAKGIVHLVVFAVLVSLADSNGVFGIFVAGWIFYQAIEAHHTARARRDGTPLPNPFGLNDIGERFGFGKAWPHYPASPNAEPRAYPGTVPGAVPPATPAGAPYQAPAANWGAPRETYPFGQPAAAPYPPYPPFAQTAYTPPPVPPFAPGFGGESYAPFDPARAGFEPPLVTPRNRFPAGAIWLIALGTLFLLNTSGVFRGFPFHMLLPLFFLGLGIWTFVRKMTDTGLGLADDGSPAYRVRLFRAARGAVWLILLGVIFFLADFDILPWSRSWPLFLILAGVMTFLERSIYSGGGANWTGYGYGPGPAAPYAAPRADAPATAPVETRLTKADDETTPTKEGR